MGVVGGQPHEREGETVREGLSQKQQIADAVADEIAAWLREMIVGGAPVDALLAGAHAAIITEMVLRLGGPETAAACRRAEARAKDLPSEAAVRLAFSVPRGSA